MGRRSLAEQRKAEILDAFGRCVARFGLEGSSLEKIAEEAGMKRSILRHYIGNRDELVDALAEKVISDYRQQTQYWFDNFRPKKRQQDLIEFLLPAKPTGTTEELLVIEALIAAADQYPKVRQLVFASIDDFIQLVADQLKQISPKSTRKKCWEVAYGLVCISFNQESLQPLQLPKKYLNSARNVAHALIAGLV